MKRYQPSFNAAGGSSSMASEPVGSAQPHMSPRMGAGMNNAYAYNGPSSSSSPRYQQQPEERFASAASFFNVDPSAARMGLTVGREALNAGQTYVEKNVTRWISMNRLRFYFNVSNSYVIHKIGIILFPWIHKPWARAAVHSDATGGIEGYESPRLDINCPDLYIPLMSFVTYVLLLAMFAGIKGNFKPEMLGLNASRAFGVVITEILGIKLASYILSIPDETHNLDLLAYSGYKFVGIVTTMLVGALNVKWLWALAFFYTFFANAFFLLRSLRYVIIPSTSNTMASTAHLQGRNRRIYFLFGISMIQILSMRILI